MPDRPALLRSALAVIALLLLRPQPFPLAIAEDFHTAQTATLQKNYDAAADALADAARRLPYVGLIAYRAGLAEISAQRFDAAVRHLLISAALDGWTPAKRIAVGDAYLGLGDRASALKHWVFALEARPEDDGVLARLANSYEAAEQYEDAVNALTALARVRPTDPNVSYRLALLKAVIDPAEALARLRLVVATSPPLALNAWRLIDAVEAGEASGDEAYMSGRVGFALIQLEEWRLAEAALTRAVALNPNYADAYAYLGLAQDMQAKDGRAAAEKAAALTPDSPLANFFLGLHWRRAGESGTALNFLQKAQALDPQNPAIAAEIGGAYASLADLSNAEVWFTRAVELDAKNPDFWLLLARFYTDNEYHVPDLGLPAARMAAGLDPSGALAADTLGYALLLTGDFVNSEKALEHALSLGPNLPNAYYHLGLLYYRQGKYTEAEAAFKHTLALDPQGTYGGLAFKALALVSH